MSWKKAVFFGGAVLVLAACNDAMAPSSPSSLTKLDGAALSAKTATATTTDSTTVTSPPTTPTTIGDCASAVIHVGLDGQLVVVCMPSGGW